MIRRLHALPGLLAAIILCVCAVTGAILALEPPVERLQGTSSGSPGPTVGEVAQRILSHNNGIDRVVRGPNGTLLVHRRVGEDIVVFVADPLSGELQQRHEPSAAFDLTRRLHRSLLLGTAGRGAAGVGALAMLLLSVSGIVLLAQRLGGWRAVFRPIRGTKAQRWHCELARATSLGLLLSATSGLYLSLVTFDVLPDPSAQVEVEAPPGFANARPRFVPLDRMDELQTVPISQLRELTFPRPGEPVVMRLTTARGTSILDRASGALIVSEPHATAAKVHEWIYSLHTGQGLWPLAILLGLSALSVPVLAGTGASIWWRRRREMPRIRNNVRDQAADTILLVGSQSGTTWRHAAALHAGLTAAGHRVHVAPMNGLARRYAGARRILILTSTYGDGAAPASARHFMDRLASLDTLAPVSVLGFGDRSFRHYCQFARDVSAALIARGHPELLPIACIDRQSGQDFEVWTQRLAASLGVHIAVDPAAEHHKTLPLRLIERTNCGEDVQAPTAILRFVLDPALKGRRWQPWLPVGRTGLPPYQPGDLLGIRPADGAAPRFYSIGSSTADGMLEICVRKQPGGQCSSVLHALCPGNSIQAFIKPNPIFRPSNGKAPLLLIGAGAGIAPLVGLVRANRGRRAIHLYWGGRHPASDFLYEGELSFYLSDRRLTRLRPIFSRLKNGGYVQDRLAQEANVLRDLVRDGAQIMVCGNSHMASAVASTIECSIAPLGLDLGTLMARGRYVEDVY